MKPKISIRSVLRFLATNLYIHLFLYVPLFAQAVLAIFVEAFHEINSNDERGMAAASAALFCVFVLGLISARFLRISRNFWNSYFPMFLASFFALVWIMLVWLMPEEGDPEVYLTVLSILFLLPNAAYIFALESAIYVFVWEWFFYYVAAVAALYSLPIFVKTIYLNGWANWKKTSCVLGASNAALYLCVVPPIVNEFRGLIPNEVFRLGSVIWEGWYYDTKKPVKLRGKPQIYFEKDMPVLDGATAFAPIYVTAARALYEKPKDIENWEFADRYFRVSRTGYAYDRLIKSEVDMIFVLEPSEQQIRDAKARGVEFDLIPIGREAFVFINNAKNPVKSLTIEQIKDIYSGEIDNWKEVGGEDEEILAFQRKSGSGSQTAFENFMKGRKIISAPAMIIEEMEGLLRVVADYRNAKNAIGYSFRFYATKMVLEHVKEINLIAINGVAPTTENIQNETYPLIRTFYIVTRKGDVLPNAQKLIDWFISDQGQALIYDVGYTPIKAIGK